MVNYLARSLRAWSRGPKVPVLPPNATVGDMLAALNKLGIKKATYDLRSSYDRGRAGAGRSGSPESTEGIKP